MSVRPWQQRVWHNSMTRGWQAWWLIWYATHHSSSLVLNNHNTMRARLQQWPHPWHNKEEDSMMKRMTSPIAHLMCHLTLSTAMIMTTTQQGQGHNSGCIHDVIGCHEEDNMDNITSLMAHSICHTYPQWLWPQPWCNEGKATTVTMPIIWQESPNPTKKPILTTRTHVQRKDLLF